MEIIFMVKTKVEKLIANPYCGIRAAHFNAFAL